MDPNDFRNELLLRLLAAHDGPGDNDGPGEGPSAPLFRTREGEARICFAEKAPSLRVLTDRQTGAAGAGDSTDLHLLHNAHIFSEPSRHTLLRVRTFKPEAFVGPIPLQEIAILKDDTYRAILDEERSKNQTTAERLASMSVAGMENRRATDQHTNLRAAKVDNFIKKVQESRLGRSAAKRRRRPAPVATIVQEGSPLPSFRWVVDIDAYVPTPTRRLRPMPARRPVLTANSRLTPQRLLIQVIEARNVPMRDKSGRNGQDYYEDDNGRRRQDNNRRSNQRQDFEADDQELLKEMARTSKGGAGDRFDFDEDIDLVGLRERSRVSPFIKISFRDHEAKTAPAEGTNARWKETITMPLEDLTSDLTPQRLLEMNDNIYVSLFDEVRIKQGDASRRGVSGRDAGEQEGLLEQRYLGQLSIPFSTVYKAGRVEGFFKVMTPDVTMGYAAKRGKKNSGYDNSSQGASRSAWAGIGGIPGFGGGNTPSGDGRPSSPRGGGGDDGGGGNAAFSTSAHELMIQGESATYLKVMCTLDPHLPAPNLDIDIVQADESGKLVRHARHWLAKMRGWHGDNDGFESREDRVFEAMVPNMHGEHVFLSRYLRPAGQAPPSDALYRWEEGGAPKPPSGDASYGYRQDVAHCARFVSMIPFLDDFKAFKEYDMWCTSGQFLDILAGDWGEHAVLLWNYFQWLKVNGKWPGNRDDVVFYLVIGRAIPEGHSVYVLQYYPGDPRTAVFWNACTGHAYAAGDPRCPLQDVGCLVTPDNIYGNTQRDGRPQVLSQSGGGLDVTDASRWQPFFNPKMSKDKRDAFRVGASIQEPVLDYPRPANDTTCEELQEQLEELIKTHLRGWREKLRQSRGAKTKFTEFMKIELRNRLAEVLEQLESNKVSSNPKPIDYSRIRQQTNDRELHAVTLNFPYTDTEAVLDKIKTVGAHECMHDDVQYLLAVHVAPYPCGIFSVWVYYGTALPIGR